MSSVLWVKRSDWLHAIAAVGTAHLVCLSVVLLCTESLGIALLSAFDGTCNAAEQISSAVH